MTPRQLEFFADGRTPFAVTVAADVLCRAAPCDKYLEQGGEVLRRVQDEALRVARTFGHVTADDLHAVDLGGRDPRIIGSALRGLVRAGYIEGDGYVVSLRSECHHRPIRRFRWVGAYTQAQGRPPLGEDAP